MKNVSEMRTKDNNLVRMATCGPEAAGEHNARRLGDARQRPTLLGLARREYKEEAGTSAFRLLRRDFLGSRIRQLLLAHSNTRHGWNVSARDLAKRKNQRISQERKNKIHTDTNEKPTRKTRKAFGENSEGIIPARAPQRNNKKSRKNSGENTGEKTGVPWNAKFASTFSRVLTDNSPKDDDASPSV